MKKIILIILSVLCLVSCNQSEKKNDLTEENLKGKVKSIKETTYEAIEKFGQIEKGDVSYYAYAVTIYNEKGDRIEENHYNSDGSLDYKVTYKYDENGNKIEGNIYFSNGKLDKKVTYKYDEKGNIIELNGYNSDGSLLYKYTYKYDKKENIIEKNRYNSNGSLDEKYTYKYEYDKNNNWIQQVVYENNKPIGIKERIIEYYP